MEEDYVEDMKFFQVNGGLGKDFELEDDFMSDLESDEEFSTLYSCSICKASDMILGEFIIHTKEHSREERKLALDKLVDLKLTEEVALRNAAEAYGFKIQTSLKSPISLYVCTICGQGNLLLKHLKDHSNIHPQFTESNFCNICQQHLSSKEKLNTHLEIHLENNDLLCQYCNKHFNTIDDLEVHESQHYQADYVCVECKESFRSKELVLRHLKTTHSSGFFCLICDVEFKTAALIEKHFITHANIQVFKKIIKCFSCEYCAKKYDSKTSLQRHVLFLHNNRLPLVCEHCGFVAYHKIPLKEHLKKEHSNSDTFICYKCGLPFTEKTTFNLHMASHTENKVYKCKYCKIMSKSLEKLKYHLTSHGDFSILNIKAEKVTIVESNDETIEKDSGYICEYCGKSFVSKDKYGLHTLCHLPSVVCNLCGKAFKSETLLNVHFNSFHTCKFFKSDIKNCGFPFKCNKCKASFRLEFELEDHKGHHNLPLYQCHLCFKEFDKDNILQDHLKTHTQEKHSETTRGLIKISEW